MEHLDGLKRSDFCNFDKPCKCPCQKEKIESVKAKQECGIAWMPDSVKSFAEVDSCSNRLRARLRFAKLIQMDRKKIKNLIQSMPIRVETSLWWGIENGVRLQKMMQFSDAFKQL